MNQPEEDNPARANLLRRRAEEALRGNPVEIYDLATKDIQYVLHELQVYQAELSIQNDELRRVQQELEISRDLYSDLYNFAPVGYCTISAKGTILETNQTLANMLGSRREAMVHTLFAHFVDRVDQDRYYLYRQAAFADHQLQVTQLNMVRQNGEKRLFRLESTRAHDDETRLRVMLSDITEQERIEKEAQEAALLRELHHLLSDKREEEHLLLARELHDGPLQGLVALTFALSGILMDYPDPALAEELKMVQADLRKQIGELRTFALELRPPMISNFGLEKTIRSHVELIQEQHPQIHLQMEVTQLKLHLPAAASLALFRIYQEAIANILKHVQGADTRIIVRLNQNENEVRLEIEDNGPGFAVPEQMNELVRNGHLGLVGMHERAEAIGGLLEIRSQVGKGTQVIARVPLIT
jgi:PAS domain S-box-containing protein